MTIGQVADLVGVSRPTIWSWETDRSIPRPGRIPALAQSFHVSEDELIVATVATETPRTTTLDEEISDSKARIAELAGTNPENVEITIKF